MKILIIGGSQFIGKYICKACLENGHEVTLFNRGNFSAPTGTKSITGDVENLVEFKDEIVSQGFDAVVHCIAFFEKHASDLISVFEGTNAHLIVLGSADCYEVFQGLNRQKDLAELPVSERSQLSTIKYYWRDSGIKGDRAAKYDKNLMTDILIKAANEKNLRVTVFRLPFVYGPDDYQYPGRHGQFIRRALDKRKLLVLSDREQCQVYTYGYVENIAAAVTHSLQFEITFGKVYNLGESVSRSRRRWANLYGQILGWEFDFHILPEELLRKDAVFRNAPPQHLLLDSSLFAKETGFTDLVALEEGIIRTVRFAKANPEALGPSDDYEKEDRMINLYYSMIDEIHEKLAL